MSLVLGEFSRQLPFAPSDPLSTLPHLAPAPGGLLVWAASGSSGLWFLAGLGQQAVLAADLEEEKKWNQVLLPLASLATAHPLPRPPEW